MPTLTLRRNNGTSANVPVLEKPLAWQTAGLTYTASGYGRRIPTRHIVRIDGKWRRVYCCIFSNIGTCYVGKFSDGNIITD
jgi:hypothetical protein